MQFVTLQEARDHLRIDGSADDAWLTLMIQAVSQAVVLWLKEAWRAYELETDSTGQIVTDSNGDPVPQWDSNGPIVKPTVKAAVLVELASLYRFREGEGAQHVQPHWGHGYSLSAVATALLTPLRRSTVV